MNLPPVGGVRLFACVLWSVVTQGAFLMQREPGCAAGLAVLAVQFRVIRFQLLRIEAGAGHGVPGGVPSVAGQIFGSLVVHLSFDHVLDGFGLCFQICDHGLDLSQLHDFCIEFVNTHCVFLLYLLPPLL